MTYCYMQTTFSYLTYSMIVFNRAPHIISTGLSWQCWCVSNIVQRILALLDAILSHKYMHLPLVWYIYIYALYIYMFIHNCYLGKYSSPPLYIYTAWYSLDMAPGDSTIVLLRPWGLNRCVHTGGWRVRGWHRWWGGGLLVSSQLYINHSTNRIQSTTILLAQALLTIVICAK